MTEHASDPAAPLTEQEREQLRLMRLHFGWSYREMADQIGLTESTLKNVLNQPDLEPRDTTVYRVRVWLRAQSEVAQP